MVIEERVDEILAGVQLGVGGWLMSVFGIGGDRRVLLLVGTVDFFSRCEEGPANRCFLLRGRAGQHLFERCLDERVRFVELF